MERSSKQELIDLQKALFILKLNFTNLETVAIGSFGLTSFDIEYDSAEINALVAGGATEDSSGNTVFLNKF